MRIGSGDKLVSYGRGREPTCTGSSPNRTCVEPSSLPTTTRQAAAEATTLTASGGRPRGPRASDARRTRGKETTRAILWGMSGQATQMTALRCSGAGAGAVTGVMGQRRAAAKKKSTSRTDPEPARAKGLERLVAPPRPAALQHTPRARQRPHSPRLLARRAPICPATNNPGVGEL